MSAPATRPRTLGDLDFVVIGAMKAATTSLCDWLDAQPGVHVSHPKEPSIFVDDEAVDSWQDRVDTLFPAEVEPGALLGEGSTDYSKLPDITGVPERLHRHRPDVRIVYVLRHPLSRAVSQHTFEWLIGGKATSFERALEERPGLVDYSRYAHQLEPWLATFAPEQVLVVFADAFATRPEEQVAAVLRHLGAPADQPVRRPEATRSNEASTLVRPSLARRLLRDSWLGERVRPFVPPPLAAALRRRRIRRSTPPPLSDETTARLTAVLDQDLARLSDLLEIPTLTCRTWSDIAPTTGPVVVPHRGTSRVTES